MCQQVSSKVVGVVARISDSEGINVAKFNLTLYYLQLQFESYLLRQTMYKRRWTVSFAGNEKQIN